jgi:hypothetical protein
MESTPCFLLEEARSNRHAGAHCKRVGSKKALAAERKK